MASKIEIQDYDVDMNTDLAAIEKKMPRLQTKMIEEMQEFHQIPCDRLVIFQGKQEGDFSSWSDKRFLELVDSIREHGVIEPITVRPIPESNQFEILAGEHRWKASKELGLETVPARVKSGCSDEEAIAIFSLTNVMKRDTTLKDKAFGCWLYTTHTKYKTPLQIRDLYQQGILSKDEMTEPLSRTQMYRYSRVYELPADLFELVNEATIDLKAGSRLATLASDQQELVGKYVHLVKNSKTVDTIMDLALGDIPGEYWEEESFLRLLSPQKNKKEQQQKKNTLAYASAQAKVIIKDKIPKKLYDRTDEILTEALALYFEKHPVTEEKRKK